VRRGFTDETGGQSNEIDDSGALHSCFSGPLYPFLRQAVEHPSEDVDELTDEQRNESKAITFRLLYGGIDKEFLAIPFFQQVNDFVYRLWDKWKRTGCVETPVLSRNICKEDTQNMIVNLDKACKDVSQSKKVKELFRIILALGNYMNSGQRGGAFGFKLQSVLKMIDTKSNIASRKHTMLHFLIVSIMYNLKPLIYYLYLCRVVLTKIFCVFV
jgi:hypothetical protein